MRVAERDVIAHRNKQLADLAHKLEASEAEHAKAVGRIVELEAALYEITEDAAQPQGYYTDETEAVVKDVLQRVEARAVLEPRDA